MITSAGPAAGMVLGSERLDADAAYRFGLVNRIGDLDAALDWTGEIAALAPLTLQYSKSVLQGEPEPLEPFERCWSSDDLREGQLARAEKRAPRFRGV